jgi:Tol biopolymer transport system component
MLLAIALSLCAASLLAAPFGRVTCIIRKDGDCRVLEFNVSGDSNWVLATSPDIRYGVSAQPHLGDTRVIHRGGPRGIEYLVSDGSVSTIVGPASSGTNVDPCVSHDGLTLAYVQLNINVAGEDILHVVNLGTGLDTPIYGSGAPSEDVIRPCFTAGGQSILFGREGSIWEIAVTGGADEALMDLPAYAMHPCVAPDGTKMACVAPNGGTFEPYVANADGSSPQKIDLGGQFALYPCFSPDSKYLATCSDNGLNIIDVQTRQVLQQIPLDYDGYYGMCWHMGAFASPGLIEKMKVSPKSIKVKARDFALVTPADFGMLKVDQTTLEFNTMGLWQNRKGKKYMYKNKELGLKAKLVVKKGKGSFKAKNLNLTEGTDYRVNQPISVTLHVTGESIIDTITLDDKGKYKAPK